MTEATYCYPSEEVKCTGCDTNCEEPCKTEKKNIGIIGFGTVGRALFAYYDDKYNVITYDKAIDRQANIDRINELCDVVFVCVNTPYAGEGQGLDCSNVRDAVGLLTGAKTVIIKSTVNPGTTDLLQEQYPQHRLLFIPEFLSEATAERDYAKPRRAHVVGYSEYPFDPNIKTILAEILDDVLPPHNGIVWLMKARQAELLKLATNAFYALKVSFANQMHDLGMTQETLDALAADPCIQPSHFTVDHKNYRGFGGACLIKDTKALQDYLKQQNLPSYTDSFSLLYTIDSYNDLLLLSQGFGGEFVVITKKDDDLAQAMNDMRPEGT